MDNSLRIEQFLRFRRQNPDWLSQIKKQRKQQEAEQKQIAKLTHRNNLKRKQLEAVKKQYERTKRNTDEVLFSMKNQEDALDQEIQSLQKKKMEDFRKTVVVEQKIEHLKEEIQTLKSQISTKQKTDNETIKNLHLEINKYKKMVGDVQERVTVHEEWLSQKQSNRNSFQPINLPELQSDLQNIKKSNESLIKQINAEQKRLKKQANEVTKEYKDYCQKTEDRIKAWIKKCDSVIDEKKEIKILLEGIDENVPLQQISQIELLYKMQLGSLSSLYQSEVVKELGDYFVPFSIKTQGTGLQKLVDKGNINQNEQKRLGNLAEELNKSKQELYECQNYIESLKQKIEKYNKDIDITKQSISQKKKL